MRTVYYYLLEIPHRKNGNWGLTLSKEKAKKLDPNFKIATIEDLDDFTCASPKRFKSKIQLQEGVYILTDILIIDRFDPDYSYFSRDYILVEPGICS